MRDLSIIGILGLLGLAVFFACGIGAALDGGFHDQDIYYDHKGTEPLGYIAVGGGVLAVVCFIVWLLF